MAHLYTVPFENLDIHLGRPLSLEQDALYDKVVTRRRGGFCYELNGLFAALLGELGFRVTMLSAEVARAAGGFSAPFDHLALRVDLAEPWLVDVGFGEGFLYPVRMDGDAGQEQNGCSYLIVRDGEYRILTRRGAAHDWTPQYRFTLAPHRLSDFAGRCLFHQTSPESHFTRNRLCTLATPEGRVTITDNRLIVTSAEGRDESTLDGEAAYSSALRQRFGVVE